MPTLHQYDYLFAVGTIFAFLDAWNIGANDVANSWATSVGSRSVTYLQAMIGASIMEFSGSLGVGARVADTIRTKVVKTESFKNAPPLLMLGMVCAVIASSVYLTIATKFGLPVSTTHSIMGGVIGMGIAALGGNGIQWVGEGGGTGVINGGVVQVFLAWVIAPICSGAFASIIFLLTKFGVLLRSNSVIRGLFLVPVYFGITGALLAMLLIWKGGGYTVNLTDAQIPGVIVGVGAAWGLLIAIFLVPWLYRVAVKEDWQMRWYHVFLGPLLWRRGEVPPPPADFDGAIRNYYEGHLTKDELESRRAGVRTDTEAGSAQNDEKRDPSGEDVQVAPSDSLEQTERLPRKKRRSLIGENPGKPFYHPAMWLYFLRVALFRGIEVDVVNAQTEKTFLGGNVEEIHARAAHYENKTEFLYSFLQVMTAATASFTHGANDIANAIGPYATIFQIWNDGALPAKDKADVPVWILAFGGVALVIGLWTYGYNIMKNLGNRITLHSPSRGFSMELGSVITVVMATRLKLPISTTQCITGATVGVGLCNGDYKAINWRMVAWIYMGWIITLPTAGLISGILMGFIINAPRWGISN